MCIIIDTNAFAPVFDENCEKHLEFEPVFQWLWSGKGRVVYGGTKYKDELKRARRYFGVFVELDKKRKAVQVDDHRVNLLQAELEARVRRRAFNDAHLIAIVIVSGCRLLCSDDSRAFPFMKDKNLYPKRFKRPKMYSGRRNQALLSHAETGELCSLCRTN